MKTIKNLSRILLVDDDEINNFYNESLLRDDLKFKGEIDTCLNGKDAIDYLKNEGPYTSSSECPRPDLILLDINMPIMNGFEFLEAYKKLNEKMKAKIIICMLTSSLNDSDRQKSLEYKDLKEYLKKPLNAKELESLLEKHFL
jgi:CheY-like chemotaxis protein